MAESKARSFHVMTLLRVVPSLALIRSQLDVVLRLDVALRCLVEIVSRSLVTCIPVDVDASTPRAQLDSLEASATLGLPWSMSFSALRHPDIGLRRRCPGPWVRCLNLNPPLPRHDSDRLIETATERALHSGSETDTHCAGAGC